MACKPAKPVAELREALADAGRHERLLALELRTRKYGFAVLDGPDTLLDWGVGSYGDEQATRTGRVDSLLRGYSPDFVVMRRKEHRSRKTANAAHAVTARIRIEARRYSAKTRFISGKQIRRFFEQYRCTNKHEIASVLAEWFCEIRWKLPAKRRPWESEKYNTPLFDAVATGVAFFDRELN